MPNVTWKEECRNTTEKLPDSVSMWKITETNISIAVENRL